MDEMCFEHKTFRSFLKTFHSERSEQIKIKHYAVSTLYETTEKLIGWLVKNQEQYFTNASTIG